MAIQFDHSVHTAAAIGAGWEPNAVSFVHPAATVKVEQSLSSVFDALADPITSRLNLVGELDIAGGQRFRDVSGAVLACDSTDVVVDLARLRFIDASGIGLLVGLRNELAEHGATLRIVNTGIRIRRIFSLCGLSAMLPASVRA